MKAIKRACGLLAMVALLGAGASARAAVPVPSTPGSYAIGDAALEPGMTLRLLRGRGAKATEVGRMRVLGISGDEVQLELLSGTAQMQSGDVVQVESAPGSAR